MKSPFEIISGLEVHKLVDEKWDTYKVYPINGYSIQDVIKSNPELSVRTAQTSSFHPDNWVIFDPHEDDRDMKEEHRKIYLYLKDLTTLSQMQIELNKTDIRNEESPELKQKIEALYNRLFAGPAQTSIPELPVKITISKDVLPELYEGLKPYFAMQHNELLKTLSGENGSRCPLVFKGKAGKQLLEVFRRVFYNDFIKDNKTSLAKWFTHHFDYIENRNGANKDKQMEFKESYAVKCISKRDGDIRLPKERICDTHKLKYKPPADIK